MSSDRTRKYQRKVRRSCHRNQTGGNIGASYSVVPVPVDPTHPFIGAARVDQTLGCLAQTSPSMITPPPAVGLPGMQRGGRYGFDMTSLPSAAGASVGQGGYPIVERLNSCEGSTAQRGGAPGGLGSPFEIAPTAGYGNAASTWTSSVGAPVQIQVPYNARAMNPACSGGARKRRHRHRKTQRRTKRRSTRKHLKKGSRKH